MKHLALTFGALKLDLFGHFALQHIQVVTI